MNGWITKQQCIILSQQPTNFLAVADCHSKIIIQQYLWHCSRKRTIRLFQPQGYGDRFKNNTKLIK